MKPGNSGDDQPDNDAAEPKAAESDTAKAGETVPDKTEAEKTEPTEAQRARAESAETELADEPAEVEESKPEPESKSEPESKPEPESEPAKADTEAKPAAKAETEPEPDPEPLMVELEKAPPIPDDEPVMPTAAEARRQRADMPRPRVLTIAFYLAIASLVVGIASVIDLWAHKAELVSGAQDPTKVAKPLTAAEAERAVTSLLWLYVVVALALGAFLTLFAYKAQDGVRRARMLALIVTLILLLFHFFFFGSLYGQVSGLFAAITIALLYLPSTREYFGPRQTTR